MMKKLVYLGLLIIILSIAASFIVGNQIASNFNSSEFGDIRMIANIQNFSLKSGNFMVFELNSSNITGRSVFTLSTAVISGKVNAYLFNESAFDSWNSLALNASGSGISDAISLEGHGALLIFGDITKNITYTESNNTANASTTPHPSSNYSAPIYEYPYINMSKGGHYYIVVDNNEGVVSSTSNTATGIVAYLGPTTENALESNPAIIGIQNALNQSQSAFNSWYLTSGGIFIIGLIITIVGLIYTPRDKKDGSSSGKPGEKSEQEMYIDELYRNVGKKSRRGSKGRKAAKRKEK
jgi:hypothetical protein